MVVPTWQGGQQLLKRWSASSAAKKKKTGHKWRKKKKNKSSARNREESIHWQLRSLVTSSSSLSEVTVPWLSGGGPGDISDLELLVRLPFGGDGGGPSFASWLSICFLRLFFSGFISSYIGSSLFFILFLWPPYSVLRLWSSHSPLWAIQVLTFEVSQAGRYFSLSGSLSAAAFASGSFIDLVIGFVVWTSP